MSGINAVQVGAIGSIASTASREGGPGERQGVQRSLGNALLRHASMHGLLFPRQRVRRGESLYVAGQRGDSVYVVESGWLKSERHTRDGKTSLLEVHVVGDVLGEDCLVTREREESVVAKQASVIRSFRRSDLLMLVSDLDLHHVLIAHMTDKSGYQRELIAHFITATSEQRLAMRLLMLANRIGHRAGEVIIIHYRFTHEDLAQMVGTTRSRVGLFLKRFEEAGLLLQRGRHLAVHARRMTQFVELQAAA